MKLFFIILGCPFRMIAAFAGTILGCFVSMITPEDGPTGEDFRALWRWAIKGVNFQ